MLLLLCEFHLQVLAPIISPREGIFQMSLQEALSLSRGLSKAGSFRFLSINLSGQSNLSVKLIPNLRKSNRIQFSPSISYTSEQLTIGSWGVCWGVCSPLVPCGERLRLLQIQMWLSGSNNRSLGRAGLEVGKQVQPLGGSSQTCWSVGQPWNPQLKDRSKRGVVGMKALTPVFKQGRLVSASPILHIKRKHQVFYSCYQQLENASKSGHASIQ